MAVNDLRICIIDGDADTHVPFRRYLSRAGVAVEQADNGHEGLRLVLASPPDLILMNSHLTGLESFALLEKLQQEPSVKHVPVIVISTSGRTSLKVKALERGAVDYVVKPFDRVELFSRIKAAVRRNHQCFLSRGVMRGHLQDMAGSELLQTLCVGRKTVSVRFPVMQGGVEIQEGRLVQARQGRFSGKSALMRLLFMDKGPYVVDFGSVDRRMDDQFMGVEHPLLSCLIALDKVEEALHVLPDRNPLVDRCDWMGEVTDRERLGSCLPLPLQDLLVLMDGDMGENAEEFVRRYLDELLTYQEWEL